MRSRSRKLLTPAMTWACLASMMQDQEDVSVITLGGNDERRFWDVWAGARSSNNPPAGHLYLPQLSQPNGAQSPLHMDRTNLAWKSRTDIRTFLQRELDGKGRLARGWHEPSRSIPWCIRCCLELPLAVRGDSLPSAVSDALSDVARDNEKATVSAFLELVVNAVADVLFGDALRQRDVGSGAAE